MSRSGNNDGWFGCQVLGRWRVFDAATILVESDAMHQFEMLAVEVLGGVPEPQLLVACADLAGQDHDSTIRLFRRLCRGCNQLRFVLIVVSARTTTACGYFPLFEQFPTNGLHNILERCRASLNQCGLLIDVDLNSCSGLQSNRLSEGF